MSTPKTTLFQKGQQIKLKAAKLCHVVGSAKNELILPRFALEFIEEGKEDFYFKVLMCSSELFQECNGKIVRIKQFCFDFLEIDRIKPPNQ